MEKEEKKELQLPVAFIIEVAHLQLLRENANNERYREELARSQGFVFPDEVRVITVH